VSKVAEIGRLVATFPVGNDDQIAGFGWRHRHPGAVATDSFRQPGDQGRHYLQPAEGERLSR
jgi:hypothetical protein